MVFKDHRLPGQLATIKTNFKGLVAAIAALEERLPLRESIGIVEKVQAELVFEPFKSKLSSVLDNNPDFRKLQHIAHIIDGTATDDMPDGMRPDIPDIFSQVPITSVDCERTFSKLKAVLTDHRTSLTESHVRDMLLIQWNSPLLM